MDRKTVRVDRRVLRVDRQMDRRVLLAKFLRTPFLQNISGQLLIKLNGYDLEKKLNCNIIKSQENTHGRGIFQLYMGFSTDCQRL